MFKILIILFSQKVRSAYTFAKTHYIEWQFSISLKLRIINIFITFKKEQIDMMPILTCNALIIVPQWVPFPVFVDIFISSPLICLFMVVSKIFIRLIIPLSSFSEINVRLVGRGLYPPIIYRINASNYRFRWEYFSDSYLLCNLRFYGVSGFCFCFLRRVWV